ncbi:hypothetical protein AB0M95_31215 [Sphaerisporangium sp. NPDC051017]|uniref:hypothetical protein n=1 Tax=Sphaerisporangium sp. NPDC051017 TaxID=3154636 RepID=UPI00342802EE
MLIDLVGLEQSGTPDSPFPQQPGRHQPIGLALRGADGVVEIGRRLADRELSVGGATQARQEIRLQPRPEARQEIRD